MKDNQFVAQVNVSFPGGEDGKRLEQWINTQYAGKPQIPLDEEVSEEHAQSHNALHRCRTLSVLIEVNKDGHWHWVGVVGYD